MNRIYTENELITSKIKFDEWLHICRTYPLEIIDRNMELIKSHMWAEIWNRQDLTVDFIEKYDKNMTNKWLNIILKKKKLQIMCGNIYLSTKNSANVLFVEILTSWLMINLITIAMR